MKLPFSSVTNVDKGKDVAGAVNVVVVIVVDVTVVNNNTFVVSAKKGFTLKLLPKNSE